MKSYLSLLLVSCSLACAVAQAPATPQPSPQLAGAANLDALKPEGLKISDAQVEDIDLYNTKIDLISSAANQQSEQISFRASSMASPWLQKRQSVVDAVLKANPGWEWHAAQTQNDMSRFQLIPPPSARPAAPPAQTSPTKGAASVAPPSSVSHATPDTPTPAPAPAPAEPAK